MHGVSHKDRNFDVTKNVGNKEDVVRYGDAKHRVFTKGYIVNHDNSRDAMSGVSHTDDNCDVNKNVGNKYGIICYGDAKHRVFTKEDIIKKITVETPCLTSLFCGIYFVF